MHIETKFNVGEKVWTIFNNKPQEMKINKIEIFIWKDSNSFNYRLSTKNINDDSFECSEEFIFATKTDLLKYWENK